MSGAARSTYHHGSLREELISASVGLIAAHGIGAVSLRRVAREAGVSAGAPYHHFPDRAALLAAISIRGSELLLEQLTLARDAADGPVGALSAVIEAYVGFAHSHSAHVHVMLRPELVDPVAHPEAATAGAGAIDLLTEIVVECQRVGAAAPGDPTALVTLVWALAIGIVTLWLDGPLENRCAEIGLTPQQVTVQITGALSALLRRPQQSTPIQ